MVDTDHRDEFKICCKVPRLNFYAGEEKFSIYVFDEFDAVLKHHFNFF
jgi:hypothetical protein